MYYKKKIITTSQRVREVFRKLNLKRERMAIKQEIIATSTRIRQVFKNKLVKKRFVEK